MRLVYIAFIGLVLVISSQGPASAQSEDLAPLLAKLRNVDREGKGHRQATQAWAEITAKADETQLPAILAAMDGAGPLAANWLRAAVDAIAERTLQKNGKLAGRGLEEFLAQKQHDQRARRLAFEWIARNDAKAADRLIPEMLDDPSLEMRRDAVAGVLSQADKSLAEKKNDLAIEGYGKALDFARDLDQVKSTAEALKKLGRPVDLAKHFGFVADWKVVGPFDNRQGKGFNVAYPPESMLDLTATYKGTDDATLSWISHHTVDEYGYVDLNKVIAKHSGAVAYAVATFECDRPTAVELRLGSGNANKIWLNGRLLAAAEVYHANDTMDQYVGRGEMKFGQNTIVLKLCQNEQKEEWAQDWKFQLRVCDASGKAIAPASNASAARRP